MRVNYHFSSPWKVAEFFLALGIFTSSEYWSNLFDSRIACVEVSDNERSIVDGYAKAYGGKEMPPDKAGDKR
jgi:hypothetical protein